MNTKQRYIRCYRIPPNECSKNYKTGNSLPGTSCYETEENNGLFSIPNRWGSRHVNSGKLRRFLDDARKTRKQVDFNNSEQEPKTDEEEEKHIFYLITGIRHEDSGDDGEPLLTDIEVEDILVMDINKPVFARATEEQVWHLQGIYPKHFLDYKRE